MKNTFHACIPFSFSQNERKTSSFVSIYFICLMKSSSSLTHSLTHSVARSPPQVRRFYWRIFNLTLMKWKSFYFSLHLGRTWFVYGSSVVLLFSIFSLTSFCSSLLAALRATTKIFSLIFPPPISSQCMWIFENVVRNFLHCHGHFFEAKFKV